MSHFMPAPTLPVSTLALRARVRRGLRAVIVATAALAVSVSVSAQQMLRDAETERLMKDITAPILKSANIPDNSVNLLLLQSDDVNAFVAEGQNIFMFTGLLLRADNVGQVIGVYAHETGHITGGHLYRMDEGMKGATGISLLSLLLAAGAIAAGAGDAGVAILSGGQTLAAGKFFAFSRGQESSADQAGAQFLEKSGYSGRGLIEFFGKLQNDEYRLGVKQETYFRSHPLSSDRVTRLEDIVTRSPYYNAPPNTQLEYRFQRVKAKLAGYIYEPKRTFIMYPESDTSEPARYARAYAWHKLGETAKAREEMQALLSLHPDDPFYLELLGQVLLESGQAQDSVPPLRRAVALAPNEPLIQSTLGHALISTENPDDFAEARKILETCVRLDPENPFAWYQLGIVYARLNDEPRAALASAERLSRSGDMPQAAYYARQAVRGLKSGSPEWLRAQDIALMTDNILNKSKKKRRPKPDEQKQS